MMMDVSQPCVTKHIDVVVVNEASHSNSRAFSLLDLSHKELICQHRHKCCITDKQ
jgi:hypothetical protein